MFEALCTQQNLLKMFVQQSITISPLPLSKAQVSKHQQRKPQLCILTPLVFYSQTQES